MTSPSVLASPNFLRNVLRVDALSCLACGALQVAAPGVMAQLLNLPQALVMWTGEFLLVFAAFVFLLSTRKPMPRAMVWALVAGNLGWAVACVGLLFLGGLKPSVLGVAYVVVQALTVALLAELQFFGLRRTASQPAW